MKLARWQIFLIISSLLHIGFIVFEFSYYEEGADTFIKNTLSGVFIENQAIPPLSFGAHFLISYVYGGFYHFFPDIPWYDIFTVMYSILAMCMILCAIQRILKKNIWTTLIVGTALYLDNIFFIEITRISLCLAIACSFLLLTSKKNKTSSFTLFLIAVLSLSIFLRVESFILALGLLSVLFLVERGLLKNLKLLLPSIVILIAVLIVINIDWTERDKNYNDLREYQFVLLDFETKPNNNFESKEDSLTMSAAKIFFLNDPAKINSKFLGKYLKPLDKNPLQIVNYFEFTDFSLTAFSKKLYRIGYRYLLLWSTYLIFILYLVITRKVSRRLILAICSYLAILMGLFLFMKLENRILLPTLVGLILTVGHFTKEKSHIFIIAFLSLVINFLPDNNYTVLRERFDTFLQVEEYLKTMDQEKTIVFDIHGSIFYGRKPFHQHDIEQDIFCFDNSLLCLTKEYKMHIQKHFNTGEANQLYHMFSQQNGVLFVGELRRAEIINNYFNQLYGFNIEIHTFDKLDSKTSLYELRESE